MAAPIEIVGGMSMPHSISILSRDFVATAKYRGRSRAIDCVVHPLVASFFTRHRWIPVPRVIRFLMFLFSMSPILMTVLMGWPIIDYIINGPTPPIPPIPLEDRCIIFLLVQLRLLPLLVGLLVFVKLSIGSWHAAEHMAIGAYERLTSTELIAIALQDRVHPKCGGRLMAPILLATFISMCVGPINHLMLSQLVLIECILWIDALIGFDKIPVFRTLSTLLQRYITTRNPGYAELLTAQNGRARAHRRA